MPASPASWAPASRGLCRPCGSLSPSSTTTCPPRSPMPSCRRTRRRAAGSSASGSPARATGSSSARGPTPTGASRSCVMSSAASSAAGGADRRLPSAEREWAACGMDHKRRARGLEEHIEIWHMLWRGEPVTYRGNDFELTDHTIGPLPWHEAGPPVLITAGNRGEMLAASFDRFGRLGDGIITTYVHYDECRLVGRLGGEAPAPHERAPPPLPLLVVTPAAPGGGVAAAP